MTLAEKNRNYIVSAITSLLWICLIKVVWPTGIPYNHGTFWHTHGTSVLQGVFAGWPVFVWGASISVILATSAHRLSSHGTSAGVLFVVGLLRSAQAGLLEEIAFRWLIFLGAIPSVKIANFLIFGWLGFGIPSWLHLRIAAPIADFFTLHALHGWLFSPHGWAVGAALLSTNAFFRDGHKYLGWLGFVNSWFIGMFLFWIMFHYGLLAAILVHFVYDVIVFSIAAANVAIRNR